jgi:CheY-like chemotaxis protein
VAIFGSVVGRRVLVVDDDPDIRDLLVSALTDDGYEAEAAGNGREALDKLEGFDADVVVLDLMMPVMDGWTFARHMKERRDIPIVVLSAANDVARHGAAIGAAGIVPKPFDLEQLLPTIERLTTEDDT